MKTGRDVVIAALLGAEEFGFATAPLRCSGCIMMRVCHLNTCPVGVATQDPELRKKFAGQPEHVVNFFRFVAEEVRELMARPRLPHARRDDRARGPAKREAGAGPLEGEGPRLLADSVPAAGRAERRHPPHPRSRTTASSSARHQHDPAADRERWKRRPVRHHPADSQRQPHGRHHPRLRSHEALRRGGLPEDTIRIHFNGSAGQSFGAFLPTGMTLTLEGDANDYFGKGPFGRQTRRRIRRAKRRSCPRRTSSSATSRSTARPPARPISAAMAGERFAVRNSGAHAVVEGVGDHGCEYMTGGRVVVLGPTGATSPPACRAAWPSCSTCAATSSVAAIPAMVDLEALAAAEETSSSSRN